MTYSSGTFDLACFDLLFSETTSKIFKYSKNPNFFLRALNIILVIQRVVFSKNKTARKSINVSL
jgi:hypothetical protein